MKIDRRTFAWSLAGCCVAGPLMPAAGAAEPTPQEGPTS